MSFTVSAIVQCLVAQSASDVPLIQLDYRRTGGWPLRFEAGDGAHHRAPTLTVVDASLVPPRPTSPVAAEPGPSESTACGILSAAPTSSAYVDEALPSAYADALSSTMAELTAEACSRDPAEGLQAVAALRRLLERLEELHVRNARSAGWSWSEIAALLGVTKQTVHRKYKDRC